MSRKKTITGGASVGEAGQTPASLRKADGYVDAVLRAIPPEVEAALSEEQMVALAAAVAKATRGRRHMVDLRISLPLYVTRLYCVLLIGQDRRTHVKRTLVDRRNQGRSTASAMLMSSVAVALTGTFLLGLFLILYTAKSMMGIDIFPGIHFRELFFG